MKKIKLRRLGDIMLDLEPLLEEMVIGHDLQRHEVMNLIHGYVQMHFKDSLEEYEDGSEIEFYCGPKR